MYVKSYVLHLKGFVFLQNILLVLFLLYHRSTQWKVHGSCAESVPGVQNISQYFTKAVKLANMYNIKE